MPAYSKDRNRGPSSSQVSSRLGPPPSLGQRVGEVGREERVGELTRHHCLRYDAPADRRLDRLRLRRLLLDRGLQASRLEHVAPQGLGRIGDGGVLVEQ